MSASKPLEMFYRVPGRRTPRQPSSSRQDRSPSDRDGAYPDSLGNNLSGNVARPSPYQSLRVPQSHSRILDILDMLDQAISLTQLNDGGGDDGDGDSDIDDDDDDSQTLPRRTTQEQ
jgi:hypothetical protein